MPRRARVLANDQQFGPTSKKTTSQVWNHFEVPLDPIQPQWSKRVRCVECHRPFVCTGSTSVLRRHLEFEHPERFQEIQDPEPDYQNFESQPEVSVTPQQVTRVCFFNPTILGVDLLVGGMHPEGQLTNDSG